jgi:membrane protease subunit HflK
VKAVAESAMREVIGRSDIQPILTGARQGIETGVQELMQKTLDTYGAGVLVQQVQLQKVDPPAQVIDSFRDVQAARADLERAQNEAQTYANRVVPEARGRAAQILQAADAYKSQTCRRGDRSDFALQARSRGIQEGARGDAQAHVSRNHGTRHGRHRKIILDSNGQSVLAWCPTLPLNEWAAAANSGGAELEAPDEGRYRGGSSSSSFLPRVVLGYSSYSRSIRHSRRGGPARSAVRVVTEPGLNFKVPLIDR